MGALPSRHRTVRRLARFQDVRGYRPTVVLQHSGSYYSTHNGTRTTVMSEYFGTDDAGDGGDQGLGGEHEDYAGGHANFGQEQDHSEHDAALAQTHLQEHDAHYLHVHHVEYDDGHGGHYEVDD